MIRPPAAGRRSARAWLAPVAAVLAAGCVTTYEPVDFTNPDSELIAAPPIVIPIGDFRGNSNNKLLLEFYSGILRRLHEAASDGDVALLDSLVTAYDRPSTPDSVKEHLKSFRAMGRGIRFRQHVARKATFELRLSPVDIAAGKKTPVEDRVEPALGEELRLDLRIPAMAEPVLLGGHEHTDPFTFSVSVTVEDEYFDGRTRSSHTDGAVWLPQSFNLADGNELTLPVNIDRVTDDAVRRHVIVRVDMRGHVLIDGIRSPVQSTTIGAGSFTQLPAGHEIIQAQPLAALKLAIADFQAKNFASAYLAALLMPQADRVAAATLLVDQIRYGRADQAQVAMAALKRLSGLSLAVGDRDAWLAWWQTEGSREHLRSSATGVDGR